MRALMTLVVVMGVLIVLGVGVLGVTIVKRLSVGPVHSAAATLEEPAGTRMIGLASAGDRIAVLLQGGGPDRLVVLDPRTGAVTARLGLAH